MGIFLDILVVGHAVLDHRVGDKVLQFVLVTFVECFELVVNIYDKILPDIGERVLLLLYSCNCAGQADRASPRM